MAVLMIFRKFESRAQGCGEVLGVVKIVKGACQ